MDRNGTSHKGDLSVTPIERKLDHGSHSFSEADILATVRQIFSERKGLQDLLSAVTSRFLGLSGCCAGGIRLRDESDYPYIETQGFPEEFIEAENSLCSMDSDGLVRCDVDNRPLLEGMCGTVISGRIENSSPFFTQKGSFWSNSASKLKEASCETLRNGCTRGGCNRFGFETVALIPLCTHGKCFGLIQLNDTKPNRLTIQKIETLEMISEFVSYSVANMMTEERLRLSERRYRLLTESSFDVIWSTDLNLRPTYVSPSIEKLRGYSVEEVMEQTPAQIMTRESLELAGHAVAIRLEEERQNPIDSRPQTLTFEYLRKDGDTVWAESTVSYLRNSRGNLVGFMGIARDITERKRIEEELRESQAELFQTLNATTDAIWRVDFRTQKVSMSERYYTMLGYDPGEFPLTFERFVDLLHDDDRDRVLEENKEFEQSNRETHESEFRLRTKSGDYLWIRSRLRAVERNENGIPLLIVGSHEDITERYLAEEKSRELEQRIQHSQKMEAIGQLAGGIAHDFNNLLTGILGYADLARDEVSKGSEAENYLDSVIEGGKRASELINQILTFSRKSDVIQKPLRLQTILEESLRLLRPAIPSTIKIEHRIEPDLKPILANLSHIQQVIMNLAANAQHAMRGRGGTLEFCLDSKKIAENVAAERGIPAGEYARLTIRDTGHGMSEEVRKRIFEPYYTTKKEGEGTGMGLATVHGIIQNHNGVIQVRSIVGEGTKFTILFPFTQTSEEPLSVSSGLKDLSAGKETILFVDDDERLVKMTQLGLRKLNYEVEAYTDSVAALEAFCHSPEKYDVVITDQTMPLMTGAELAKKILEVRPQCPVILCTGFSEIVDEERASELGIRQYVRKPIGIRELVESIRNVLQ